ncbi:PTS lactose/cellobiose transporter subunit IIA [Erysipelothrix larvae]|nr:PTS lactose/cellobiose transporter subunit IIA [Erysipelothrix larvae]
MKIILHAGDARLKSQTAIDKAKIKKFAESYELLDAAQEDIVLAHKAQTDIIQSEMAGVYHGNSLLFTHAQDTLMTIMSEIKLTLAIIELFEISVK